MSVNEAALIRRMQENLAVIRKVGGWTTAQFGDEIGVTRQTISNLEKGKTPLTKTQYLAIRAVLIHEIGSKENEALAQVVRRLVDEPVEEPEDEPVSDGDIRPTESAMEDMSRMTELLAGGAAFAATAATLGLATLPSATVQTVPALVYSITKALAKKK